MTIVSRLMLLALAASTGLVLMHSPFATNDGPVHLSFAQIIASYGDPESPLQRAAYALDLRPTPNLIGYFILVPLMKVMPAHAAESALQWLCLVGPVLAGWFAIRQIDAKNEYLAVALFPFSLNQMFFLGLYNYALSIAAFFVAIGLYLRLDAAPSARRAVALAASLLLAFFCHAAGFIMAVTGIVAMSGTKLAIRLARGEPRRAALWEYRHVLLSLLIPLPVCVLFVSATEGAPVAYGTGLSSRIEQFGDLYQLAVSPGITRHMAMGIRTALAFGVFWALTSLLVRRRELSPACFERATAAAAAGGIALLVMLLIPDTLGGGWTHFRRMVLFPYFWMVLLLACMPIPRMGAAIALAVAVGASAVALRSAVNVQQTIERQLAPLAEVDRRIGTHCSVMPVVLETHPLDESGHPMDIEFNPFFQAASRLELKNDRVVLFNFLARLDVYPVRFKPDVEPQQHLFGWLPYQHLIVTQQFDIENYERVSGMPVDYLLVWGKTATPDLPQLRRQIAAETARSELVYRSADGWVSLYQRPQMKGGRCRPPESPTGRELPPAHPGLTPTRLSPAVCPKCRTPRD